MSKETEMGIQKELGCRQSGVSIEKEKIPFVVPAPSKPMSFSINHLIAQLQEEYLSESKQKRRKRKKTNRR
jgi:hypothetical protein